ncbi:hypothetical protein A9Q90_06255, partial [Gammaproteobacteria bacterium 54_18_T64]
MASVKRLWLDYQVSARLAGLTSEETCKELIHQVHGLAGSGGTFGYTALSDVAKKLEAHLLSGGVSRSYSVEDRQVISALVDELAVAVEQGIPHRSELNTEAPLPIWDVPPGEQLVYLVEDDSDLSLDIAQRLEDYGY